MGAYRFREIVMDSRVSFLGSSTSQRFASLGAGPAPGITRNSAGFPGPFGNYLARLVNVSTNRMGRHLDGYA